MLLVALMAQHAHNKVIAIFFLLQELLVLTVKWIVET